MTWKGPEGHVACAVTETSGGRDQEACGLICLASAAEEHSKPGHGRQLPCSLSITMSSRLHTSSSSSSVTSPPPRTGSAGRPGTLSGPPSLPSLSAAVSASLSSRDHQLNYADQSRRREHPSLFRLISGSSTWIKRSRPGTAELFRGLGGRSLPGTAPAIFTTSSKSFFRGVGSAAATTTTTGGYNCDRTITSTPRRP
ncbi:hypothetical protein BJ165DRAFT_1128506 [Panaeolus papilionaceus]|nr:hypothetical protein BJ165DRAFT_1128506 [Panaeolus papilionaceus]